jgi:CHAT domain-containing protein/Tfp pilus assembly protein PilF
MMVSGRSPILLMLRARSLGLAMLLLAGLPWPLPARAQTSEQMGEMTKLMGELIELTKASRYKEAIEANRKLIDLFDAIGMGENPMQAANYVALANLYRFDGQIDAAEPFLEQSLALREKLLGPNHPDVANSLLALVDFYLAKGRTADAQTAIERALKIQRRSLPKNSPDLAMATLTQARIFYARAQYTKAGEITRAALDVFRAKLGKDHPFAGVALNNLADIERALGRYGDAEKLMIEANTINAKEFGAESQMAATGLNNLAELYRAQGRYAEAEALRQREVRMIEKLLGAENPALVASLNNYGTLLSARGRPEEAEAVIRRALSIQQKSLPPDHPDLALVLNNLGDTLSGQERFEEAEAVFRQSLAIREKGGPAAIASVATVLDNLSVLFETQKRYAEAEPLARRSLAINEQHYGSEHPSVAVGLNNLGVILDNQSRHDAAEPLLRRALAIRQKTLGDTHPDVAIQYSNLGANQLDRRDWRGAYASFKQATAIWLKRRAALASSDRSGGTAHGSSEIDRNADAFLGLVRAADALRGTGQAGSDNELNEVAFDAAQWAMGSAAAGAVQQLGARLLAGNAAMATLAREQQDLGNRWVALDKALLAALATAGEQRDTEAIAELRNDLDVTAKRLGEIEAELAKAFPDYAALIAAKPLRLADVRAQLGPAQTLVIVLPMRAGTYVWAVTRDEVRWQRRDLPTAVANDQVRALRCGLDLAAWQGAAAAFCQQQFGPLAQGAMLPFDPVRAHTLYRTLFAGIEPLIEGHELLLVSSGAFTTLPMHVLVTEPPPAGAVAAGAFRSIAWLAKQSTITVLPSVASLVALSSVGTPSQATKPYLGIGNPLLGGPDGNDRRAWKLASCADVGDGSLALAPVTRVLTPAPGPGLAAARSLIALRRAAPLPETAAELCTVAQALGGTTQDDVLLGARSTESVVKAMDSDKRLSNYKIVHIATHGLIADETRSLREELSEPALLLTPPDGEPDVAALARDDGLLTASEVMLLKLDADWVVLSACNTASGGSIKAQALSGLARAFFFAGARSLLVSHWPVYSDAAVKLTTSAFSALKDNPERGRAAALQVAMKSLITSTTAFEAHPSFWAPFVVVGSGAR